MWTLPSNKDLPEWNREPTGFSLTTDEKDRLVRYLLRARRLMFETWNVDDYLYTFENDHG